MMKGMLLGEAGGHLPIFYIDLLLTGSLLVLKSCYFGNLEANFTRELLVVEGWLLGELKATLQITQSQIF